MLRKDDLVIVDTEEGEEIGTVAIPNRTLEDEKIPKELKRVVRIANSRDLKFYEDCKRKEKEIQKTTKRRTKRRARRTRRSRSRPNARKSRGRGGHTNPCRRKF